MAVGPRCRRPGFARDGRVSGFSRRICSDRHRSKSVILFAYIVHFAGTRCGPLRRADGLDSGVCATSGQERKTFPLSGVQDRDQAINSGRFKPLRRQAVLMPNQHVVITRRSWGRSSSEQSQAWSTLGVQGIEEPDPQLQQNRSVRFPQPIFLVKRRHQVIRWVASALARIRRSGFAV